MKIHAFHDGAACGKIRICMPGELLRDEGGHQVTMSHGWTNGMRLTKEETADYRNENALTAELLVAQRIARMDGTALWRRLKPGRKLVYEIDDDLWNIDPSNLGAYLKHDAAAKDASEMAIMASDLVTVSTEPLAEVVRKYNSNVAVLPNCIHGQILEMTRTRREKVVVGWAGGDSHLRDLALIMPTLKRLGHQNSNVEFHTIGADFLSLFKVKGRHTPWQANLLDLYHAMDFDVALAPLTDTVFNRSKSGIKAMEAMALGIPVIASDLEPYRGIVVHGVTGFLVSQRHQWMGYLRELTGDSDLREKMGQAGREAARSMTIQAGWKRWEDAYTGVLARPSLV